MVRARARHHPELASSGFERVWQFTAACAAFGLALPMIVRQLYIWLDSQHRVMPSFYLLKVAYFFGLSPYHIIYFGPLLVVMMSAFYASVGFLSALLAHHLSRQRLFYLVASALVFVVLALIWIAGPDPFTSIT